MPSDSIFWLFLVAAVNLNWWSNSTYSQSWLGQTQPIVNLNSQSNLTHSQISIDSQISTCNQLTQTGPRVKLDSITFPVMVIALDSLLLLTLSWWIVTSQLLVEFWHSVVFNSQSILSIDPPQLPQSFADFQQWWPGLTTLNTKSFLINPKIEIHGFYFIKNVVYSPQIWKLIDPDSTKKPATISYLKDIVPPAFDADSKINAGKIEQYKALQLFWELELAKYKEEQTDLRAITKVIFEITSARMINQVAYLDLDP